MNTPKPEISRKQAWCKLAILIADGLPEPNSISFNHGDPSIFTMHVDSIDAYRAWVAALDCTTLSANTQADGKVQHQAIGHRAWYGCTPWVYAYLSDPEPDPVDEDITAVRAIAADTCVCCSPGDCGDRRGHVRDDRNGEYQCNCGREWPCEKERA